MKTKFLKISLCILASAALLMILSISCKKTDDDNEGKMWDPNWLIGTWEGTTPASITPFENTKIRIVFDAYNLESHDTTPGGEAKTYAYSGRFIWDVDNRSWSMNFTHANFPIPDYNVIIWGCMNSIGNQTVNNVSLRIGDTLQVDPYHSIDLDWGPFVDNSGNPPTSIDFYGDVEIDYNGNLLRADYPPDEGSMIRLTKK